MFTLRAKIAAVALVLLFGTISALGWTSWVRGEKIKKLEATLAQNELVIAAHKDKELLLEELRSSAAEIGQISAEACRATVSFRVKHTVESMEIQNAEDDAAAAAAYDRLLCERPEAASHPKCARADPLSE